MEKECDLVGEVEKVKKLESPKKYDNEACHTWWLKIDTFDGWKVMANEAHDNNDWKSLTV